MTFIKNENAMNGMCMCFCRIPVFKYFNKALRLNTAKFCFTVVNEINGSHFKSQTRYTHIKHMLHRVYNCYYI